jgi:hypothetical protein
VNVTLRLDQDWLFLAHFLLKDFGLRVYPNEFLGLKSVKALASYLAAEMEPSGGGTRAEGKWTWQPVSPHTGPRVSNVVFVLSTPRAGSTLLRVMLAGHPDLFSPPELCLLPFASMGERDRQLRRLGYLYMGLGLEQAVTLMRGSDREAGLAAISSWVRQDLPVAQVYQTLREQSRARILVDKTPMYAARVDWMARAEQGFEGARYIFLIRHPYSVINSMVRMRFHRMIGAGLGSALADPWQYAADIWARWNSNIASFIEGVERSRVHFVRYEEMVTEPEKAMGDLAAFLGLPFHRLMVDPYGDDRMTHGDSKHVYTVGDPNFSRREKLDPSLAGWEHVKVPRTAAAMVRDAAARFGYEIP